MRDNSEEPGAYGELLPGQTGFDEAILQGDFEFARTRFARAITIEKVGAIVEEARQKRARYRHEIDQLRFVVRSKHEDAVALARTYASVLPHRVGKTWIQPPTQLEKVGVFHGSERLYKQAARATKDYVELRDLLVKRHFQLLTMEQHLRDQLDRREAALIAELETPRALQIALLRDPLLNVAYQKLKALQDELEATHAETAIGELA